MPAINLGVRFLLELAMLAAFAYWGFSTGASWIVRILLGIGTPLVAIALWGMFIAPKARTLLPEPARLGLEIVLFASAAAALVAAGRREWAIALVIVTVINIALMFVFDQR